MIGEFLALHVIYCLNSIIETERASSICCYKAGVFKVWKVSLPSENIRTAASPLPIIIIAIIIIIIVVVAIMQGYSIAFQRGPVRENEDCFSPLVSSLCVCV